MKVDMFKHLLFIIIILSPSNLYAGPPNSQDFINRGKTQSSSMLRTLDGVIKELPKMQRDKKTVAEIVKYLRTEVSNIKSGQTISAPMLYPPYDVGDVGLVGIVSVFQVFDGKNLLVEYDYDNLNREESKVLFWLETDTTKYITDVNSSVIVKSIIRLTGTKTYTNVMGGSNTVFTIKIIKDVNDIVLPYKLTNGKTRTYKVITLSSIMDNVEKIVAKHKK